MIGEGNGNPLQYSCLENPMDRGAWWAAVHGGAKSRAGLSDFTFTFHFHALEKEMATHSSVLAWKLPGMGAWWAAIYGVAQSWTRLKRLSRSKHMIGEDNVNLLQYSHLGNPMDGGTWWTTVHGVVRSQTRLSNFTFTFHFHALEKEMGTYSSVLAWRIPGTGEPGGLPSMGSHRVGHD